MIVFVSPGLEDGPAVGTLGLHLTREEALDLRNVLTDALNMPVLEHLAVKAWFTYANCYAQTDPVEAEEPEAYVPPSPFPELEERGVYGDFDGTDD